jgi:hypothetical protein
MRPDMRMTPAKVGSALTLLAVAGCVTAVATIPSDLGPTAAVLTPVIYVLVATYGIAAIWTCVGLLKRLSGGRRRRVLIVGATGIGLCLLIPLGAAFVQPVLWVIAIVLNWPRRWRPRPVGFRPTQTLG